MTGDGKLLKISSLVSLFVGAATCVIGIVLAVGNMLDMDALLTAGEGLVATVYGVRTAILANVPSNTAKFRKKALVLLVLALGVGAYFVYVRQSVTLAQFALAAIVGAIALYAVMLSTKIVKDQLRK